MALSCIPLSELVSFAFSTISFFVIYLLYNNISHPIQELFQAFMIQPRQDVPGLFDITSVTAAQAAPEEGISAFIFRVETTDQTLYVLQVAHQTVVNGCEKLHITDSLFVLLLLLSNAVKFFFFFYIPYMSLFEFCLFTFIYYSPPLQFPKAGHLGMLGVLYSV